MFEFGYKLINSAFKKDLSDLILRGESIILLGASYTGKRQVMNHLYADLQENEHQSIVIALKLRHMRPITSDRKLRELIEREVQREAVQKGIELPSGAHCSDESFFAPMDGLMTEAGKPVTLLASNVDSLGHHLARRFLKGVRTRVEARRLIVVLSGEEDLRDLVHGPNSEFNCANQYVLQGFDEDELGTYISKGAEALNIVFESPREAYRELWKRTGGNPFLLKLLLWSVVERRLRCSLPADEAIKISDIPDSLDNIYTPGIYEIDVMRHTIRLIARKPECWKDLEHLINGEPEKVLLKNEPNPLELFGVAARRDGHLGFSCPLKAGFFKQYYNDLGLGDLYARNGQWKEAFKRYSRLDLDEIVRPLNIDDRSEVDVTVTSLCAFLHQAATEDAISVMSLFAQGCLYVLGFKEITFWKHDEHEKKWRFQPLDVVPVQKEAQMEIRKMISGIPGVKPDGATLVDVPERWKGLAIAAVLPSLRSNQSGLVVISDIERGITISRERQELAEKLLRHFLKAYNHVISVERNSARLCAREQHVKIVNSIFESLGKDVLNVKQALIMAAGKLRKLGYGRVSFSLVDPEGKTIKGVCDAPENPSANITVSANCSLEDGDTNPHAHVIKTRQAMIVTHINEGPFPNQSVVSPAGMEASAIVPIQNRNGDAIGTVLVVREDGTIPTPEEVEDLLYFGPQLAVAIEQSERVNLLQSTLDQIPAPVLIVDRLGRLRYANRPSEDLFAVRRGWHTQVGAKPLTDDELGGLLKHVNDSLARGRVVDYIDCLADREYHGFVLCDVVRDWENRTVGALVHLQDLDDLHRILRAYRLLAEAKDTEWALSSLLEAAKVLGYEWGRLYVTDETRPDCLVSKLCFGNENEEIKEEFNRGGFVLKRKHAPGYVAWRCLEERAPLIFTYRKDRPDDERFFNKFGLAMINVNPPYAPSPWMEKKPGDIWIHVPLISKVMGKLVLPCTEDLSPGQVDLLEVFSEMVGGLFDAFQDREKEFQKRADRIVANIVHHIGTRVTFLPGLLWRYEEIVKSLPGMREPAATVHEINRDFSRGIEDLLTWIKRTETQLLSIVRLRPNLKLSRVSLTDLMERVLRLSFENAYDLDTGGLEMFIQADVHLLEIAMMELLHNSRLMGAKRVSITIVPMEKAAREEWVRIIYKDNGPGVSHELKEKIFMDFFSRRLHEANTCAGLGMGTVRRAVEAHGGAVREDGIPGEGVRFVIEIPFTATAGER